VFGEYLDTSIFYKEEEKLTFTNRVKHGIKTSDEIPVHTGAYRNPFVYKQVGREMKEMLNHNIISKASHCTTKANRPRPSSYDQRSTRSKVCLNISEFYDFQNHFFLFRNISLQYLLGEYKIRLSIYS
jgi:hypothetical protein